ncbi:tripartite motif-containing protein 16-like [Erpetoichthys calabaricus]|uniref:tripartite motif-containing protein 16-like n=1 Tax=Erpetoichthys calabaricus TaxID=27687 RepID=UPI002234D55F|nr:tripartite motif-containing protein 16-like [Erpetoichthys calabaricus]
MAAPQLSLSTDRYSCSVCLDVLKEPVTIPCGHNYCMRCINDYWDQSDKERVYNCPQCRRTFNVRPELNKNAMLKDIIENLKSREADVDPAWSCAEPDDVPCDVCPVRNRRAVKTCMTCMISYCETHLQPHKENGAYKRHKLEEPTGNLEEKLCAKHQEVLKIFCRIDETCVCLMCAVTEHKSHDTVTPEEERAERQTQLENKMTEMKSQMEEKEKELEEIKDMVMVIQISAEKEIQEYEKTFRAVLESIERLRSEVTMVIREYERREVGKAEELIKRLEKEIEALKRRDAELAELSQTDDHIHFLKKFLSFCDPPREEDGTDITIDIDIFRRTLDLCDLMKSLEDVSDWEFVKTSETGADDSSHILQNLRCRNHLLKYFCPLTLDPNTAHRLLCLSEENRKVTCEVTESLYPNHPDRFDHWNQVLCTEALSGTRCYWEVEWSGDETAIGVACKGIHRKGNGVEILLGYNDKSWVLCYDDCVYVFWFNKMHTVIDAPYSHRIGIYLDCPGGSLSFYAISEDTVTLLYRFKASFDEPLYASFHVPLPDSSVTICSLLASSE